MSLRVFFQSHRRAVSISRCTRCYRKSNTSYRILGHLDPRTDVLYFSSNSIYHATECTAIIGCLAQTGPRVPSYTVTIENHVIDHVYRTPLILTITNRISAQAARAGTLPLLQYAFEVAYAYTIIKKLHTK